MRLHVIVLCIAFIGFGVVYGVSQAVDEHNTNELTAADLRVEYARLAPINCALREHPWIIEYGDFPKVLGTFNSREVRDVYVRGGCVDPGSVELLYSDVAEADCSAIGQPVYSYGFDRHYSGCTPLISVNGRLMDKGFSWSIYYRPNRDQTKLPVEEALLFDDASRCYKRQENVACSDFREGQRVSVMATRSEHSLVVSTLDVKGLGER